jgi:hypothetical protein
LRAGISQQLAVLHRTIQQGSDSTALVPNARIEVRNAATGAVLAFNPAADTICIVPRNDSRGVIQASCYRSTPQSSFVVAGQTYNLTIQLPDGGVLTGTTQVPGTFRMVRPAVTTCILPPMDTLPMVWTQSAGAWVYAAETTIRNLKPFIESKGLKQKDDPLRLFGLSLSNQDTSITFPGQFGLFQRFDEDLTEVLIAIQHGLPGGVVADVVISATDRNYVNWERGGNFNPSGIVRVPSIRGAGTGVFGSMVPRTMVIRIGGTGAPPC